LTGAQARVGRPGCSDPAASSDRQSSLISELAAALPTQTARPIVLFRAIPNKRRQDLQTPGERDNKPLLICN